MIRQILNDQAKKSIKECLRLVEAYPKDKRLRLRLGDLYFKNGEKEKAAKEYLKVGDLYAEEDLNAKATAMYKRVVSIDPKHIEVLHRMASLYLKEGLLGDARGCYERILKVKPDDQEAINALSAIEDSKQPNRVQTGPQIEEALLAEPGDSPPLSSSDGAGISSPDKDLELHYHLGVGYKEMGLFDYAITEFELACEDPSMKFECYIMLGECFREKGDSEESIKYFELASKIGKLPKGILLDGTSTGG